MTRQGDPTGEAEAHAQAIQFAIECEGLQEWWGPESGPMGRLRAAREFLLSAAALPAPGEARQLTLNLAQALTYMHDLLFGTADRRRVVAFLTASGFGTPETLAGLRSLVDDDDDDAMPLACADCRTEQAFRGRDARCFDHTEFVTTPAPGEEGEGPVRSALAALVTLKDGPRGAAYEAAKPGAWEDARSALATPVEEGDVASLTRQRDRARHLWAMTSGETVQVVTTMLDLAADGGLPAMVEALAEWTDGLELTVELADKVRAARAAALSSAPGERGAGEGERWETVEGAWWDDKFSEVLAVSRHSTNPDPDRYQPLFRRIPAPEAPEVTPAVGEALAALTDLTVSTEEAIENARTILAPEAPEGGAK